LIHRKVFTTGKISKPVTVFNIRETCPIGIEILHLIYLFNNFNPVLKLGYKEKFIYL